ncbi:putative quinol monooxygenase [Pseudodesulfovibrio tunisiensis]|uniref:putative quinol monooxygenase n=1 Tax=Pseudodesulfovibrio tunisiensis TaxID=463192 RepID=UPI001FB22107|nr:hypothetical protein [Pseudodesulfovibrio tunisiensis]
MGQQVIIADHVLFSVRPGMADTARPLFAELVANSRKDAGCVRHEMHAARTIRAASCSLSCGVPNQT